MLFLDETTYVFDADGLVLGRLASATADLLIKSAREHRDDKVVIVNAEKAIVTGSKTAVFKQVSRKVQVKPCKKRAIFPKNA